jgi:hypothetical protein
MTYLKVLSERSITNCIEDGKSLGLSSLQTIICVGPLTTPAEINYMVLTAVNLNRLQRHSQLPFALKEGFKTCKSWGTGRDICAFSNVPHAYNAPSEVIAIP